MRLRVRARGKINWSLDVCGQRPDGYHVLDMLMSSVSLCDLLTIDEADRLSLSVSGEGRRFVPASDGNLVLTAARALQEAGKVSAGARIRLRKFIPVGAGMGGGSSDAAAALVALNRLWGLNFPTEKLEEIGLTVGADVPFCIRGGFMRVRGIGEDLTPLPLEKSYAMLMTQPCRGLSTREVFTALHTEGIPEAERPDNDALALALQEGRYAEIKKNMGNVLEAVSREKRPRIGEAVEAFLQEGALCAQMTGSGSAVFGVFGRVRDMEMARRRLLERFPDLKAMKTMPCGVEIEEEAQA